MKKTLAISLLALAALGSCKKDFLEEKRDLTGMNEEVYKDPLMAKAYTGYIYGLFQPADGASAMTVYQTNNNGGYSDLYTRTTDEMSGQTELDIG